jgi:hypothetical protein
MRRNFDKRGRDPRFIDLAAIIGLLALVIAASVVLSEAAKESASPTAIHTTVRVWYSGFLRSAMTASCRSGTPAAFAILDRKGGGEIEHNKEALRDHLGGVRFHGCGGSTC